ncbi:hypothetical protein N7468_007411 [Penicillium chermesinum]|uniref:ER-bound oxygenase mpaB/mpaB'/Rubber oxygenase catalytic domain-containing protein n=1 Tax=Penicillium chermesinum TaxID=63820 RepID=A0A9W9NU14_9EURO|nr:uncharacterized protein N7468_007411 [Penicillium chermesinum]KAJ5226186.1 hypothetical protein N7468_007411 [Penicillium chermesinum]KAJ6160627.1 hypothetical protein N7470_004023 [Penicillium chermesinum]
MSPLTPSHGNGTECHYWGYSFYWTSEHHSKEELWHMVHTYDALADECVQILNKIPSGDSDKPFRKDFYGLLKEHADEDPKLKELWTQINTFPEWVDWGQIERAQNTFYRYGLPILNALSFESLLGGMGSQRVVETLTRTGGFGVKVVHRRLLETLQHILQVNESIDAMRPGGEGSVSSVRVRLLHSCVRQKILGLADEQPEYYDVAKHGVPVSDLDCIGTISTFCSTVVWMGLPRQGIYLREAEIADYIALWRLVAYYMGTPIEPFENPTRAKAWMESLLVSEFHPTDTGQVLAQNIILGLENTAPAYASKGFMEAMGRLLNGEQLSDELGLPHTGLYYRLLIWGYCFWIWGMAMVIPKIGFLDRFAISQRRKRFRRMIRDEKVGLGGESKFDFKYIPTLRRRTTRLGQRRSIKIERRGVEFLAQLGLFVVFGATATLVLGLVFAMYEFPTSSPRLLNAIRV